jgi:neutral ceramidase
MSRSVLPFAFCLCAITLTACAKLDPKPLPAPAPQGRPVPMYPELRAGFGRADITPPPGPGLTGNGPEGKPSRGWRTRLYARALYLQDAGGERVVFITADLPHVSALLHRLTAEALDTVPDSLRIGADHLIISATHDHSAPGHFYEAAELNETASSVAGYDPVLTARIVRGFLAAVQEAQTHLAPARVAWGQMEVWGHTRNRSYGAFRQNAPAWSWYTPPPGLDPEQEAVNPIWTMLRVDLRDSRGTWRPAGAYSVFAIHGTGNPTENALWDADIQGLMERGLERWIDAKNGVAPGFRPRAVHLVANGTEGDVSPDWPVNSRCPVPILRPISRPAGPRTPDAWDWIHPPTAEVNVCLSVARRYVNDVGDTLARRAIALFDRLGSSLSSDLTLGVAFKTLHLRSPDSTRLGICGRPQIGTSTTGGADDGRTRFYRWKFLGLVPVGLEEGGSAINHDPRGCQREKQTFLNAVARNHGLPEYAQVTVARIGDMYLGAVPLEPTTMAGAEMQRAIGAAAGLSWAESRQRVAIVALTNGFLNYVTTRAEYALQSYEGGSTLFGPHESEAFAAQLGGLATAIVAAGGHSPENTVDSIIGYPGDSVRVLPSDSSRGAPSSPEPEWVSCGGDTLVGRWIGAYPSQLHLESGPTVRIERSEAGVWVTAAEDDDPELEVWSLGKWKGGWAYEVRWVPGTVTGPFRLRVLEAPGTAGAPSSTPCSSHGRPLQQ